MRTLFGKRTDDSSPQCNVPTKVDITRDRQVVKFKNLGNLLESLLELRDLLEVVTKLNDRRRLKHPLLVDDELTVL